MKSRKTAYRAGVYLLLGIGALPLLTTPIFFFIGIMALLGVSTMGGKSLALIASSLIFYALVLAYPVTFMISFQKARERLSREDKKCFYFASLPLVQLVAIFLAYLVWDFITRNYL